MLEAKVSRTGCKIEAGGPVFRVDDCGHGFMIITPNVQEGDGND